jgi:branched-chain amino acid aminotransferase
MTPGDGTDATESSGPIDATDTDGYVAHVDGDLVPPGAATVPVRDRGFLYGDAAFETLRVYGGAAFAWEAHARRLRETCDALQIDHGFADADLRTRVDETLAANDLAEAAVRLSITRGVQSGSLTPTPVPARTSDPTVVVAVDALPRGGRGGAPVWDGPATVQTVKTRRTPDRTIPARAKAHSYLESVLARLELRVTEADEALVLDPEGHVAGGAASSIFFVSDEALCTPSLEGPVHPGVTREVVVDLARAEGIPVREGRFTPDDVRGAAEVFVTNTTWEVRPVATVDGIDCGGGPVTTLLSRLFDERVERECYGDGGPGRGGRGGTDGGGDAGAVDSRWDVGDGG